VFGALALKASGTVNAVAPSGAATLVNTGGSTGFTTVPNITFPATPAAGNLLVVTVFAPSGATPLATPTGWTQIDGSAQSTSRPQQVFKRIADGTETAFSATYSGSNASWGVMYSEWHGATNVAPITGTAVNSGTSTPTLGPSAAPPAVNALPLFFSVARNATGKIASVPAGWTLPRADNTVYVPILTYMQAPPNAAVSETVTLTQTTNNFYQWASTWIY